MAKDRVSARAWTEAIGLPILAFAVGLAGEVLFPRVEASLVVFLGLVVAAMRHPGRPAWAAYGVTTALYVFHAVYPIAHPRLPFRAISEIPILIAAGALIVYGQIRSRRLQSEASVREQRELERFRSLLASSPDGIWSVDADRTTLYANESMAAMLGTTIDEMIGTPFMPYFTEEGLQLAFGAFEKAKRGEPTSFEVPLRRKDGTVAWSLCSTHPILDEKGNLLEGFGILRDITARHRAEQERQQALSLLEATIESTADGLLVVDAAGRIARFNDRFATMWRLPADILASGDDSRALEFVLSQLEDPDAFLSKVRKLYGEPDAESFDTLRFKDGRVFERYSMPQRLKGEIVGRVWSFRDVTERVRAMEVERLAMEREASIARNLDAALFTFALGPNHTVGRYEYISRGAESLYGVPREELERDPTFWIRRCHSDDLESVVKPAMARLAGLLPAMIEVRYQSSRGIHRWHRSHLFPRREANGEIHVDGIEADVTERVKLEEQLRHAQKMEAIGQLAGGVAHDFNNILTAVIGYSDLLLSRLGESDPNRRAVLEIRRGGERAAGLTRQLLAFGRRMTTQPRLVSPDAAIRDLEPMLRRLVGENIAFELALGAEASVRMDPTQLEQVIVNLAVNARDALPRGGLIRVETTSVHLGGEATGTLADGRYVRLRFSDTGTGIPPDVLDHIFEPFFTTKEQGRGTGLGLAMVYGIVRQHRGTIEVRSEVGTGTEFTIFLPVADGEEPPARAPATTAIGGRERILLVEDDPALLVLGREILAELGYDVAAARSGPEALQVLGAGEKEFDLLVTDVVMPAMSGRDLAREVTARQPGVKILFVSGYAADLGPPEERDAPSPVLLEKPYTPLALARAVRDVLETASPGRAGTPLPR